MLEKLSAWYSKHFYSYAEAKTWLTANFFVLIGGMGVVWSQMPDEAKSLIIQTLFSRFGIPTSWVVVGIAVVGLILRLKKQTPAEPPAVPVPQDAIETLPGADPVNVTQIQRTQADPGPL